MNIPHDRFCVLPWVSLETSPVGTVRPCCLAEDELVDDAGEKFNLATAKFTAIQNSHSMKELRRQFINQEQPQTCRKCWREERSGRTSKRMHTLDRLKHMLAHETVWTVDAMPLMFLDLKLGNINAMSIDNAFRGTCASCRENNGRSISQFGILAF